MTPWIDIHLSGSRINVSAFAESKVIGIPSLWAVGYTLGVIVATDGFEPIRTCHTLLSQTLLLYLSFGLLDILLGL